MVLVIRVEQSVKGWDPHDHWRTHWSRSEWCWRGGGKASISFAKKLVPACIVLAIKLETAIPQISSD
jgi:hypothetical protein